MTRPFEFTPLEKTVTVAATCLVLWALLFAAGFAAFAAPADDGQTAGSRLWTLNAGRLFVAITPDDSNDLAIAPTRWVMTAGAAGCALNVRGADNGTTAVVLTLNPGVMYALQVKRILATSTTCTSIVAVY